MALFEARQKNQFWHYYLSNLGKSTPRKAWWSGYARYALAAAAEASAPFCRFLSLLIFLVCNFYIFEDITRGKRG